MVKPSSCGFCGAEHRTSDWKLTVIWDYNQPSLLWLFCLFLLPFSIHPPDALSLSHRSQFPYFHIRLTCSNPWLSLPTHTPVSSFPLSSPASSTCSLPHCCVVFHSKDSFILFSPPATCSLFRYYQPVCKALLPPSPWTDSVNLLFYIYVLFPGTYLWLIRIKSCIQLQVN